MHGRRHGAISIILSIVAAGLVATPSSATERKPDLVVVTAKTGSTSVVAGDDIRVSDTVRNKGRGAAGASVTKYALSVDAKAGNDVKIPKVRKVSRLAPGKASKGAVTVTVPASVPAADYKLLVCADGTKKVTESNERNNCFVAGDLAVYAASDHDLIDQALADGKIDAETAITYEVFSDFGDPRLPTRFSGDDSLATESDALMEVAANFDSYSAETQDLLGPFLVPPYHEGSWWAQQNAGGSQQAARLQAQESYRRCFTRTPGDVGLDLPLLEKWKFVEILGGKLRVWWQDRYDATDRPVAEAMAAEIESKIWPKLTGLMGKEPLLDGGSSIMCRGGTDAIDISLADMSRAATTTVPGTCEGAAARLFFPRNLTGVERNAILAHELFHAIQFSYSVANGDLCPGGEYEWWKEASAQWVEDFVYPTEYTGEHDFAPLLLDAPYYALDDPNGPKGRDRFYGEYLLPFYLARKGNPGVVKTIWDNTTGSGMMDALAGSVGDFHEFWKRFVLANWNRGPKLDLYKDWDGLTHGAVPSVDTTLGKTKVGLDFPVDPTAANYARFTPAASLTSIEFTNNNATVPGAGIQVIVDYVDGTQKLLDWSSKETAVLCLENPEVKTVTLVFSNSQYNASVPPFDVDLEGKANLCCTGEEPGDEATPPRAVQQTGSTCPSVSGSFEYVSQDDFYNQRLTYSVDFSTTPVEGYDYSTDEHASYNITYSSNHSGTQYECSYTYTENGSLSGTIVVDASGVVEPGEPSVTGQASEGREVVVSPNTLLEFEVPTTVIETWSGCANPTNNSTYTHDGSVTFDDDDIPYQGCTTGNSIQAELIRYTGPPGATSLSVDCRKVTDGGETRTLTGSLAF